MALVGSGKRLPPGWDTKLEPKSGKSYFVNYFTKNVTLDDPRIKPDTPNQETPARNGHRHVPFMGASAVQAQNPANAETVARIRTMFPTVPETHIKALLIKYHGREAVVVSALQVEKHPVRTPGPFTPPPPARVLGPAVPIACRPQPKPHSPKMKLRYLKSVFPVVEETVLLDTLVNADNNVTQATEKLINLGFNKRDTPLPRVCLKKKQAIDLSKDAPKLSPPPRPKSADEKEKIKERIRAKHSDVPEKVISIALESAAFNEETTETILAHMLEEESKNKKESTEVIESENLIRESPEARTEALPLPISGDSFKRRQKNNKNESRKLKHRAVAKKSVPNTAVKLQRGQAPVSLTPVLEEEETKTISTFVSPLLSKPVGPNKGLVKGPNESLLLEDYVPWIGAEKSLAKGPDKSLVRGSMGARGSNLSLRKGPCPSLAKGSIYAKFITSSDTRGK